MIEKLRKQDYLSDPALPLHVHIRDPQPEVSLHAHEFDELVIVEQGQTEEFFAHPKQERTVAFLQNML